jgi:FixJ family two-component response regulator
MSHASTPIVFVVDSDPSVRESLELLVRAAGWRAETFASAQQFLARPRSVVPSCLILDVTLPDLNGLELQERVVSERPDMPIIFLTGIADVAMTVRAMKRGALEFLTKPFDAEALLIGIQQAIKRSEAALGRENQLHALRTDYGSLTQREREVMTLVVSGLLNKQVGGELGISEITVKAHRKPDKHGSATSRHALNRHQLRLELTIPKGSQAARQPIIKYQSILRFNRFRFVLLI